MLEHQNLLYVVGEPVAVLKPALLSPIPRRPCGDCGSSGKRKGALPENPRDAANVQHWLSAASGEISYGVAAAST
ncbi:hypothetical protein [Paraburkholderia sp. BCC1885]|uniref:hypothetical protein n=1 Tax=Paraburkholderia sp. BCC1885 TaxID=2562669 RepID=UPI001184068D|nr:hypothetical protein [Paraburkholderia sp. BCC1885]